MRAANEPPDHLKDVITTYAQTLSGLGQVTADAAPKQALWVPAGFSAVGIATAERTATAAAPLMAVEES